MSAGDDFDVIVIGAGPAGMSAAARCAQAGLATLLVDEQPGPGGQIYRGITAPAIADRAVLGADYWHGETLVERLRGSGVDYRPCTTAWSVMRDGAEPSAHWEIGLSSAGRSRVARARHVIVATGAQERPFPIPGWTLPGVMTAGAAQILLKTAGLVTGGKTVIAGTGPLLYLLVAQLAAAGARIERVLEIVRATPAEGGLASAWDFVRSPYLAKGLAIWQRARRAAPFDTGVTALRITGDTAATGVAYRCNGRNKHVEADTVLLHQGVVPGINLTRALGCAHEWNARQRCFTVTRDAWGATTVDGISIAGDGAAIRGARVAELEGEIVALDVLSRLGVGSVAHRDAAAAPLRAALRRWLRGRAFLDARYRPADATCIPDGDTIVCRCEEITAAQVADMTDHGATGPNQMKSFLRCGMGPCQGRLCGLTVTEIVARRRGLTPDETGYYRLRFPIKPVTLRELAAMPQTEASQFAVTRMKAVDSTAAQDAST
ncbi:FAD-dependent oxidoreductase [Paraburkholderia sp.]|uniref:FAD-dependent oxidoreductase n=1 Tax=Paraburkholderia sp. TaxID=1926495 RepID=UPI0039E6A893